MLGIKWFLWITTVVFYFSSKLLRIHKCELRGQPQHNLPWTNTTNLRRKLKLFEIFPIQGKRLQFNKQQPEAMAKQLENNDSQLLVPSLPDYLYPRRSVTCHLVLKVTHWLTNKICLWLRGLYAEHKTPKTSLQVCHDKKEILKAFWRC